MGLQLQESDINSLNDFAGYFAFKPNFIIKALSDCPLKTIFIDKGNQGGATATVMNDYVRRILGNHPIESKNLRPNTPIRTIRFGAQTLPLEKDAQGEVTNTVYPQFKKFFPPSLIKKDITFRNHAMILRDPQGGPDVVIEFVSYGQESQSQAGVQRWSIFLDEEAPEGFYEEQIPRLIASDGDLQIGLTPVEHICFDEETEILTKRGWKKYDEILMNDLILTYNLSSDYYEWKFMNGFYLNYVKDEELHSLINSELDAFITNGHTWVIENVRNIGNYYLEKVENLNSKHRIKGLSCFKNSDDNKLYADEFIKLVGWAVTDGTFKDGTTKTMIYQSMTAYPENCEEIRNCLKKYPNLWSEGRYEYGNRIICGKYWEGFGISCHFSLNGELAKSIRNVAHHKTVSQEFICSLSKRQLEILFETMIKGDGYRCKNGTVKFTQTENFQLLEDFQLIATLLGKKTTIREDRSNFKRYGKRRFGVYAWAESSRFSINTHYKSLKHKLQKYTGFIWCPSTENKTVIMKRNNCISISGNTWTFDKLFERAEVIYNSPTIIDYLFKTTGIRHKIKEFTGNKTGIAIIRAATDDNPTLDPRAIEEKMSKYDDVGTMEIRRYGIFHQMSGVIYKGFDPCLVINRDRYFPDGIPHDFIHARGIDFHTHTNWACGWIALSRENEAFIYNEFNPSPDRMITLEIAREVALRSKDYKFAINLIDPTADIQQANTGVSPLDDINRMFREFRRENLGMGGYWETWDTKNEIGRDRIKERIRNSRLCGRPFNNRDRDHPEKYLPTIWILDNCVQTIYGFKSWRWDEWASKSSQATKDDKNKPQDKYSHFPITIECIFKHPGFNVNRNRGSVMPYREPAYRNAFMGRM